MDYFQLKQHLTDIEALDLSEYAEKLRSNIHFLVMLDNLELTLLPKCSLTEIHLVNLSCKIDIVLMIDIVS